VVIHRYRIPFGTSVAIGDWIFKSDCESVCVFLQVATFGHDCREVANTKYNIAELLELYISDSETNVGSAGSDEDCENRRGKSRARKLYLEAHQVLTTTNSANTTNTNKTHEDQIPQIPISNLCGQIMCGI